jgi:hypothetical protein
MDTDHYELISLETHNEWYLIQFAINGKLTQAFWEHKSVRDRYPSDSLFMSYLKARAHAMLENFGDIRLLGPIEEIRYEKRA